ncbi:hypothetical protein J6590_036749 [Homalodisca vitripennis]|nr:hypothetical protein J6590_036749 [Homalodisca vitripennis]
MESLECLETKRMRKSGAVWDVPLTTSGASGMSMETVTSHNDLQIPQGTSHVLMRFPITSLTETTSLQAQKTAMGYGIENFLQPMTGFEFYPLRILETVRVIWLRLLGRMLVPDVTKPLINNNFLPEDRALEDLFEKIKLVINKYSGAERVAAKTNVSLAFKPQLQYGREINVAAIATLSLHLVFQNTRPPILTLPRLTSRTRGFICFALLRSLALLVRGMS